MVAGRHVDRHVVEVVEARAVADGVRRVVLRYPAPQVARPGTHVDLELTPSEGPAAGATLTRSYSVVEGEGCDVALSVQRSPDSRGGSVAVHGLTVGDRLVASEPLQNFPLGVGAARYVLLAGGIGVTALVAAAGALKARGVDYEMVFAGRSRARMAYLDTLQDVHGDRLRACVDDEGGALDVEALLDDIAADPRARATELYLCGPVRLMDAVRRGWARRGLPPTSLRFETFGNSGAWAPQEFVVRVPRLGAEVRVGHDTTMLEALEAAGVEMMSDCRKGECGLCQVAVLGLDGEIDHRDVFLDADEQAENTRLCACVSRVVTAGTPGRLDPPAVPVPAGEPGVVTIEVT